MWETCGVDNNLFHANWNILPNPGTKNNQRNQGGDEERNQGLNPKRFAAPYNVFVARRPRPNKHFRPILWNKSVVLAVSCHMSLEELHVDVSLSGCCICSFLQCLLVKIGCTSNCKARLQSEQTIAGVADAVHFVDGGILSFYSQVVMLRHFLSFDSIEGCISL